MTMRRIAAPSGIFLAGLMLAGCATATIENAVPAGALTQSHVEPPAIQADTMPQDARNIQTARLDSDVATTSVAPADAYPNLNVAPATAAPQISEEKKTADRAELRARQTQIAAEARGNALSNDADALRRLADRQIEETLKEIEGR